MTSERIFLARRMPRLHRSWCRRVAEGVSAAAMAQAAVPGSRRSARAARGGQSLAELVHSSRELRSRVRRPGSPPLPRLGPGTTLQIPASGINSNRLFP